MPGWVLALIGLSIVGGLIFAARKWGGLAADKRVMKNTLKAARTRKAIDNEVQKLTPDELADQLHRGM